MIDKQKKTLSHNATRSFFWSAIKNVAERKLLLLDSATMLEDLKAPSGNRLEALRGDREGQHSIRINGQWRLCFTWIEQGATNVEIVDYH